MPKTVAFLNAAAIGFGPFILAGLVWLAMAVAH